MATASVVTAVCMSLLLSPRMHVQSLRFITGIRNNLHENGEWMRGNYHEKICGPMKEVRFSYNLDASAPAGMLRFLVFLSFFLFSFVIIYFSNKFFFIIFFIKKGGRGRFCLLLLICLSIYSRLDKL